MAGSVIQEHSNGWLVYVDDRLVAELSFAETYDPFWIFNVALISGESSDLALFTSASRPISTRVLYKNKVSGAVVHDEEFLVNIYEVNAAGTLVTLRDFRMVDEETEPRETC